MTEPLRSSKVTPSAVEETKFGPEAKSLTGRISPYVENISEATAACLFTMLQGNILLLGLSHWLVASQTGVVAGILATIALWLSKTRKPWVISLVLGSITAVVDFFVHPGMFGGVVTEAIVTGIAAGLLSFAIGSLIAHLRRTRDTKAH